MNQKRDRKLMLQSLFARTIMIIPDCSNLFNNYCNKNCCYNTLNYICIDDNVNMCLYIYTRPAFKIYYYYTFNIYSFFEFVECENKINNQNYNDRIYNQN